MSISITGRHLTITPALRNYLEKRVQRLTRYGTVIDGGQFILGVEKYRHVAEGILAVNGRRIQGKVATPKMYESIDRLLDKLERQLVKNKDKLVEQTQRTRRASSRTIRTTESREGITVKTVRAPVLRLEQAVERMQSDELPFVVFQNVATGALQVVRRGKDGQPEVIEASPLSLPKRGMGDTR